MTKTPVDEDGVILIRPFADWLREQAKGTSHDELSDGLHELVARCRETGKKGTLQYTVSVQPTKGDGPLTVTDQIKIRYPEFDREGSWFYVDAAGNLSRTDPNQLAFDSLREVPPPPQTRETSTAKEGTTA